MAIPPTILPGTMLTQQYFNALREAARRGNIQVAGAGLSALDTPGGMLVQLNPAAEAMENCRRMCYLAGDRGDAPSRFPRPHPERLRPERDSLLRRGRLLRPAAARRPDRGGEPRRLPWVQYQGQALILCGQPPNNSEGILNVNMRYRWGALANQAYAVPNLDGPIYTNGFIFPIPSEWNYPTNLGISGLIMGVLEGRRTASLLACVTSGDFAGGSTTGAGESAGVMTYPANSLVFGGEFSVDSRATDPDNVPSYVPNDGTTAINRVSGDVWAVGA